MPATIKDLAKASGVSPSTVSYVLNNGPRRVGKHTRERVLAAIRQLDYHPSAVARGLSNKRMNTLGVVSAYYMVPFINYYFAAVLHGILTAAMKQQQSTTLFVGDMWADVKKSMPVFCDGRCDGLLLVGPPQGNEIVSALQQRGIPFVLVSDVHSDPHVSTVDVDNVAAARALTNHLLERGHRRIAMLGGEAGISSSILRLEGYRQALEAANIAYDDSLVLPGRYYEEAGYERTLTLMRRSAALRPTAIFCGNDPIALGALQALKELNLRVPEDVSVAGFDDIPTAAGANPPLTTVRQPMSLLGERAAEILLSQIRDGVPSGQKEVLPTELVIRDSVSEAAPGPKIGFERSA